jgi:hypothetical protein
VIVEWVESAGCTEPVLIREWRVSPIRKVVVAIAMKSLVDVLDALEGRPVDGADPALTRSS